MKEPTSESFFDELKDWSERKLILLEQYLDASSKILGYKRGADVYYVDGFAGKGMYGNGEMGSPVRAAELAEQIRREGRPYQLRCINVEQSPENFANLEASTSRFSDGVTNLPGTFVSNVDEILHQIGSNPTICFLDPFGVDGIDWSAVEQLIGHSRRAPIDLWIRFDYRVILRHAGCFNHPDPGQAKRFEILVRTYGANSPAKLHECLSRGATPEERVQDALYWYKARLNRAYKDLSPKREGYSGAYEIKSLEKQATKYHLVFASGSPKGLTLASNIVCSVEETYQKELLEYEEERTGQQSFFPTEVTMDDLAKDKVRRLKKDIVDQFRGRTISRISLHAALADKWFGKIKASHLTQALNALREEGAIVAATGATSIDKTEFTFRV